MLPSSPYTVLKLAKTTSPNELLHNDCVTLYIPLNEASQIHFNNCEAIKSEQFENGHFLKAYNL